MNNIFVGNLSFAATKEDVQKLFEQFGKVASVVIMERKKGKSRGYGFVDMPEPQELQAALTALEGKEFLGRPLSVSPVRPKEKSEYKEKVFLPPTKPWRRSEEDSDFKTSSESKEYRRDDKTSRPNGNPRYEGKSSSSKPYKKFEEPQKSWNKTENSSKPYRKDDRGARPNEGKPWVKSGGFSKPYRKDDRESRPTGNPRHEGKPWEKTKSYRNDDRDSKPWIKKDSGPKPYRKDDRGSRPNEGKPWVKKEGGSKAYTKYNAPSKSWGKSENASRHPASPAGREGKPTGNPRYEGKPWAKKEGGSKPFRKPDSSFKPFKGPSKPWPKKGEGRK